MATSSITKSFVIEGKEQVEKFSTTRKLSTKNHHKHTRVASRLLKGEELKRLTWGRKATRKKIGRIAGTFNETTINSMNDTLAGKNLSREFDTVDEMWADLTK